MLVVAAGTRPEIQAVPGLSEALEMRSRVHTTHLEGGVEHMRRALDEFGGGRVLFTHPRDRSACTAATHSAMFLVEHRLREQGIRGSSPVVLMNGLDELYPVKKYRETLEACSAKSAIQVCHSKQLVEIRQSCPRGMC